MTDIQTIARDILARKGGFVNDPADPGGATNHGVTLGTLRRLGRDLTGDGEVTEADVQRLTADQAIDIFLDQHFRAPGIAALPECLHASVFDMHVNAGANAVRILQRLLTRMGFACADDGQIGPATIRAAEAAATAAPDHLADAYAIARRNYYYRLADQRPASRRFACRRDGGKGGWIHRAEEFMAAQYRLTEAEHRARVAKWA